MQTQHFVALLALSVGLAGCAGLGGKGEPATATLAPTAGNDVRGTVSFRPEGDRVRVQAEISGLEPNSRHGFHIHEKGDCSAPDATSAGGHFNPQGTPHGHPEKTPRHAGDMPNLQADASGKATLRYTLEGVKLTEGADGVLDRAVIVHGKADDYRSQPAGDAGPRLACGVIGR